MTTRVTQRETLREYLDVEIGRFVLYAMFGEPTLTIRDVVRLSGIGRGTVFNDERRVYSKVGAFIRKLEDE